MFWKMADLGWQCPMNNLIASRYPIPEMAAAFWAPQDNCVMNLNIFFHEKRQCHVWKISGAIPKQEMGDDSSKISF